MIMNKTYCNKCLFSKPVSSGLSCEFDIPKMIQETSGDRLSTIEDFYIIDNYNCLYGFSKSQYESNLDNLKDIDIKNMVMQKADLKYYLVIDAREIKDDSFMGLMDKINHLDIKPTKISILIGPNRSEEIYQLIRENISCPKWTVHVFIASLSFNDCINIVLDTNLPNCDSWCVLFYDGTKLNNNDNININLDNIVNYLQKKFIIQQTTYMGFVENLSSLHALCLNCSLYKYLTSFIANDILKALKITTDIKLQYYETT